VMVYTPWCSHCKTLQPMWEELAAKHPRTFGALNGEAYPDFADTLGVLGFPIIFYFKKGRKFEYEGPQTLSGIEEFANIMARPSVTTLADLASLATFSANHAERILGYFKDPSSPNAETFKEATVGVGANFGLVTRDAFQAGDVDGRIVATSTEKGIIEAWDGVVDLAAWFKVALYPLIEELDHDNFSRRILKIPNLGSFVMFVDPSDALLADSLKAMLSHVAASFKGQAQFFYIDGPKHRQFAQGAGIGDKFPGLVVLNAETREHFVYQSTEGFTEAGLKQFVLSYLSGKVTSSTGVTEQHQNEELRPEVEQERDL